MLGFRTFRARRRVSAARHDYLRAQRAYDAAEHQQDAAAMHAATRPLQQAHAELVAADLALSAIAAPSPMRRLGVGA
jgi:hypothetical protein